MAEQVFIVLLVELSFIEEVFKVGKYVTHSVMDESSSDDN